MTPTPANAPDPEQMARQGLSAEPELITCAMSHCLRPACLKLPRPHPLPPHFCPDFCTPPPPLILRSSNAPSLLLPLSWHPPSSYSGPLYFTYITSVFHRVPGLPTEGLLFQALVCSFIHSFTHSRVPHSSLFLIDTHSQVCPLAEALLEDN